MATKRTKRRPAKRPTDRLTETTRLELVGVRAAVITAVTHLQIRSSVDRELATVLHRMAVAPLDAMLGEPL